MHKISFKSFAENWEKEHNGLKPNTVRKLEDDDPRLDLIEDYLFGKIKTLYIEIVRTNTRERFLRLVTDITPWEGLLIISWNPNHIIEFKNEKSKP